MKIVDLIKQALASTTIWGLIVLALNASVFKEMPLDDMIGVELRDKVVGLVDIIGWTVAFVGRLKAKAPIVALAATASGSSMMRVTPRRWPPSLACFRAVGTR